MYRWTPFDNVESDYAHTCCMLHFHSLNLLLFFLSLFSVVCYCLSANYLWMTNTCLKNSPNAVGGVFFVYWEDPLICIWLVMKRERHKVNKIWAILTSRCCYVKFNPLRSITFFGLLCLLISHVLSYSSSVHGHIKFFDIFLQVRTFYSLKKKHL